MFNTPIGLRHLNVGNIAEENNCYDGEDDVLECKVLDEDKVVECMAPFIEKGGFNSLSV